MSYQFVQFEDRSQYRLLKQSCLDNLTTPPDGMWQNFRDLSTHWSILWNKQTIGYASLDDEGKLLQFYLLDKFTFDGEKVLNKLIELKGVKTIIVGSNNPRFLSIALDRSDNYTVDTILFRGIVAKPVEAKKGVLRVLLSKDLARIVDFLNISIGAPKLWLVNYVSALIENASIYVLEDEDKIIGSCEIRPNTSMPKYADIGMVVSPPFRGQGYGTYLLHLAKNIALDRGFVPICSCEKENSASLKAIQNNGFLSDHRLLRFEC